MDPDSLQILSVSKAKCIEVVVVFKATNTITIQNSYRINMVFVPYMDGVTSEQLVHSLSLINTTQSASK